MAQFTLSWNNTTALASANVINTRALYRYKSIGGAFISTGFTPSNDLAKSAVTTDSPILDDNKVIQFKIQSLCTSNGPTDNDNGIQENIGFACITPTLSQTDTTGTATISTVGLDITKVRFTLKRASNNTTIGTPTIVNVVSNSASNTKTELLSNTNYYWQIELYAIINNVEVKSEVCSPYPFTTNETPTCNPLTDFTITSIEIL